MKAKIPRVNVDILIIEGEKILLGLLSKEWNIKGKQVFGVPGRDINFGEKIGEAVKRNIREELGCDLVSYRVIGVNANYALNNHYVGIGVVARISGRPTIQIEKDWIKWEWFSSEVIPKNLFPAAENLIKSYLEKKVCVSE